MTKEFKIHFENRSIALVNEFGDHFHNNFGFFYSYSSIEELSKVLDFFQSTKIIQNVFIKGKTTEITLSEVSRFFKVITAAGGLVHNLNGEYLLIYRKGHWDLPKGKPEVDETIETTALREVTEETGISNIKITKHITDTYHIYTLNGLSILKKTIWFEMIYEGEEQLKPQLQEDITDARWVKKDMLEGYLNKTYHTIREVFAAAISH